MYRLYNDIVLMLGAKAPSEELTVLIYMYRPNVAISLYIMGWILRLARIIPVQIGLLHGINIIFMYLLRARFVLLEKCVGKLYNKINHAFDRSWII